MNISRMNSINFGMAETRGKFRQLEVDAQMAASKKGTHELDAVQNNITKIGRYFDGDVRLKRMLDADVIILRKHKPFLERLFQKRPDDNIVYVVQKGDTPIDIVTNTAESLERNHHLFTAEKLRTSLDDMREGFELYVDSVNKLYKKGSTKKILAAINEAK